MTPRGEEQIERAVGRIEGQMAAVLSTLDALHRKLESAEEWRQHVAKQLEVMEGSQKLFSTTVNDVQTIKHTMRDAKMQLRGMMIGISLLAGGAGASLVTSLKWLFGF